jgi:hypothetical protein
LPGRLPLPADRIKVTFPSKPNPGDGRQQAGGVLSCIRSGEVSSAPDRCFRYQENDKMKRAFVTTLTLSMAIALAACDVDQTKEGELPDVEVTGGQLPEYDVETADVDVGTEEKTVEVPDVDITMPDAEGTPATGGQE